jgi:hypothetical protein
MASGVTSGFLQGLDVQIEDDPLTFPLLVKPKIGKPKLHFNVGINFHSASILDWAGKNSHFSTAVCAASSNPNPSGLNTETALTRPSSLMTISRTTVPRVCSARALDGYSAPLYAPSADL